MADPVVSGGKGLSEGGGKREKQGFLSCSSEGKEEEGERDGFSLSSARRS